MLKICKEDRNLQALKFAHVKTLQRGQEFVNVETCLHMFQTCKEDKFCEVEISVVTEVVDSIEDSASGELRSH